MNREVRIEDVAGLKSRVSWPAVFGGSVIALAAYLLLGLLFAGVGLSLTEAGVRAGTATWVAVVAGVVSVMFALFLGGWITTQLTAGETRQEACIHGMLTWAVVTALAVGMIGMGVRGGYNALLGASLVADNSGAVATANWEDAARGAGYSQDQINRWKDAAKPENIRAQAGDPQLREDVRQGAMVATWSTLAGTLLSIGAAVFGALAGMGPAFRLFPTATVVTAERQVTTVR